MIGDVYLCKQGSWATGLVWGIRLGPFRCSTTRIQQSYFYYQGVQTGTYTGR
jgi:hypothetical protein